MRNIAYYIVCAIFIAFVMALPNSWAQSTSYGSGIAIDLYEEADDYLKKGLDAEVSGNYRKAVDLYYKALMTKEKMIQLQQNDKAVLSEEYESRINRIMKLLSESKEGMGVSEEIDRLMSEVERLESEKEKLASKVSAQKTSESAFSAGDAVAMRERVSTLERQINLFEKEKSTLWRENNELIEQVADLKKALSAISDDLKFEESRRMELEQNLTTQKRGQIYDVGPKS